MEKGTTLTAVPAYTFDGATPSAALPRLCVRCGGLVRDLLLRFSPIKTTPPGHHARAGILCILVFPHSWLRSHPRRCPAALGKSPARSPPARRPPPAFNARMISKILPFRDIAAGLAARTAATRRLSLLHRRGHDAGGGRHFLAGVGVARGQVLPRTDTTAPPSGSTVRGAAIRRRCRSIHVFPSSALLQSHGHGVACAAQQVGFQPHSLHLTGGQHRPPTAGGYRLGRPRFCFVRRPPGTAASRCHPQSGADGPWAQCSAPFSQRTEQCHARLRVRFFRMYAACSPAAPRFLET